MSGQLHFLVALLPGKNASTHWIEGSMGVRAGLDYCRREKSVASSRLEHRMVQHLALSLYWLRYPVKRCEKRRKTGICILRLIFRKGYVMKNYVWVSVRISYRYFVGQINSASLIQAACSSETTANLYHSKVQRIQDKPLCIFTTVRTSNSML